MSHDEIFQSVLNAMQPAEDIGGLEGADYVDLMVAIANEALMRISAYASHAIHE